MQHRIVFKYTNYSKLDPTKTHCWVTERKFAGLLWLRVWGVQATKSRDAAIANFKYYMQKQALLKEYQRNIYYDNKC